METTTTSVPWAAESIKALFGLMLLGFTWLVGQRIIAYWDERKKWSEIQLSFLSRFYDLVGEYKEVWRIWKVYQSWNGRKIKFLDHTHAELLARASKAEGAVEAIIIKLASERCLSNLEIADLGLFRQAYQQLRQGIRDGATMKASYDDPEYVLFHDLSCSVAHLLAITRGHRMPSVLQAQENLRLILQYRDRDWKDALKRARASKLSLIPEKMDG